MTLASTCISCRRVSVRMSVRSSQLGVLLKRLNVGSRKQRPEILVFWCRKSRKTQHGLLRTKALMQLGYFTISDFRQISRYNSQTVEDRRIVMAALWNRAGHYIFALWFLSSSSSSFFFPRLMSAVGDWMSTILLHMVWRP